MKPDRIVIGAQSERAIDLMKKIYEPFMAPILVTDINSAELIKHAANSFLALKISYINAVSAICEASGADVEKVADGIGMDRSEEHTSELQSRQYLVCRLLLEKKKKQS